MPRQTLFNSPLLLGFDEVERVLDRIGKSSQDGYPPYNIEQGGHGELQIVLAVAGFSKEELSVTLEDNQLMIRGKQVDDESREYIYRGIAARQFQKSFVLADGIQVVGAGLDNGLLTVDLIRPIPAPEVKTIEISAPGGDKSKEATAIDVQPEEAAE